jgi:hypothetical protein
MSFPDVVNVASKSLSIYRFSRSYKNNHSYFSLIIMQYGGLLAIRNRHISILNSNPFWGPCRNLAVPAGMLASALIGIVNLYRPGLASFFNHRTDIIYSVLIWSVKGFQLPNCSFIMEETQWVPHISQVFKSGSDLSALEILMK